MTTIYICKCGNRKTVDDEHGGGFKCMDCVQKMIDEDIKNHSE